VKNWTTYTASTKALELEDLIAEKAKKNQLATLKQNAVSANSPKRIVESIDSREEIAKIAPYCRYHLPARRPG
jgi:hypothetical protein